MTVYTMRSLMIWGVLAAAGIGAGQGAGAKSKMIYIGTYTTKGSKGIYAARFDAETGKLAPAELAAETTDPSFLARHPKKPFLYAVNESTGKVSSFAIRGDGSQLEALNVQASGGSGPCHLAVDSTGQMLAVANYNSGSFATFPVKPDGSLEPSAGGAQFSGTGPNHSRQEGPHAHCTYFTPDNRHVLVNDLGTDRTMIYAVTPGTAKTSPGDPPFASANPGAGPRHLAFGPGNHFVYVVNEMQSTVTQFRFDQKKAVLTKMDTVSSLPPDFHGESTAAEIAISGDGRTLYVSNRGHDSIAAFRIEKDGALHLQGTVPSGGKTPRSFHIDPSGKWILVANQDSDNVVVFAVDTKTGELKPTGNTVAVKNPVCVLSSR